MAYVLSEVVQRRKFLNQRYSILGLDLFAIMSAPVDDPHLMHSSAVWDVSLEEMAAALHQIEEEVPAVDLDSTRIHELGDDNRQCFFPFSTQRSSKARQDTYVGDRGASKDASRHSQTASSIYDRDAFQGKIASLLDSDALRAELGLLSSNMPQSRRKEDVQLLSSGRSTPQSPPLAHSTPCNSTFLPVKRDGLCDAEWTALLYNEFRSRILQVSRREILKCDLDCGRIDKDLMDFVRKLYFDDRIESSSSCKGNETIQRGICNVLIEMRMVGLDIRKHLSMWHSTWQNQVDFVKGFNETLCMMPHVEVRDKLLNVSFEFGEPHRVLLNCVLMLYQWQTNRRSSINDDDLNPKDVLFHRKKRDLARLKAMTGQSADLDSEPSESNCNFVDKQNSSNEDVTKRAVEVSKKDAFFDELEWQAILFEELKLRVRNELSFLTVGKKSLYDEEDGLKVKNLPDFADVIHEVFPEIAFGSDNLCFLAKIFSGLSKFTQFNFSRHLLQWHSVYKSQPDALKRYGREDISYAWLIGELNFLNYLHNHPLRIMIDCLLMLSIDNVDANQL